MSRFQFVADHQHAFEVKRLCEIVGVARSSFYAWLAAAPGRAARAAADTALAERIRAVHDTDTAQGVPRITAELNDGAPPGARINHKRVARVMRAHAIAGFRLRRRVRTTVPEPADRKVPDLLRRDFTAARPNVKWVGDITEIPTAAGKLYLATVIDLYSRRLLGAATSRHPDAELACAAIRMAVTTRGGKETIWREVESERVIFHTDRGSTYTAHDFTTLCRQQGIRQSMGRVGSCFDNAAAEAFFSSLEWEVLSRHDFATIDQARAIVLDWCYGFYNHDRRHSTIGMLSPINYETSTAVPAGEAA